MTTYNVYGRCSVSKAELFRVFTQLLYEIPDSHRPDTLRFLLYAIMLNKITCQIIVQVVVLALDTF